MKVRITRGICKGLEGTLIRENVVLLTWPDDEEPEEFYFGPSEYEVLD